MNTTNNNDFSMNHTNIYYIHLYVNSVLNLIGVLHFSEAFGFVVLGVVLTLFVGVVIYCFYR